MTQAIELDTFSVERKIYQILGTAIAMQKLAFLDFVGEGDELRLQLIFLPTFEERVKVIKMRIPAITIIYYETF